VEFGVDLYVYTIRGGTERLKAYIPLLMRGNFLEKYCFLQPQNPCGDYNILPLDGVDGLAAEYAEIALRSESVTGNIEDFLVNRESTFMSRTIFSPPLLTGTVDCQPTTIPKLYGCTESGCGPVEFWDEAIPVQEEWDLPPVNQVDPSWIDQNLVRVLTIVGFSYSTSTEAGSFYTSPRMAIGLASSAQNYQQMPNYINGYWRSNISFAPYTNGYPTECGMKATYLPTASDTALTKYYDGPAQIQWDWTRLSFNFFENGNFRNTPQQSCKFGTTISWPNIDHYVYKPDGTLLYKIEIGGQPNPYPQNGAPTPTQCSYTIRTLLTFNISVPITVRLANQTDLETEYAIRVAAIPGPTFQFNVPDVPNVVSSLTATAVSAGISIVLDRAFDVALSSTFPIVGTILASITDVDISFDVEKSCS